MFWFASFSTIIGSRLGHCFFYSSAYYLEHPAQILNLKRGGMASHGAAIGLLVGLWLFSRKNKMSYLWSLDRIMIPVTICGALVRLGNLFNSEIYGVETSLPWGFIFERAGETVPRHPTQIYEALCYLASFFILIWLYYRRDLARRRPGFLFGMGIALVFTSRFLIEQIKTTQVAFESDMSLHMGQWLSIPFVIGGLGMIAWSLRRPELTPKPISKIKERMARRAASKKKT